MYYFVAQRWIRPNRDNIQQTKPEQIVTCGVDGYWDFDAERPTYVLRNVAEIEETFQALFMK